MMNSFSPRILLLLLLLFLFPSGSISQEERDNHAERSHISSHRRRVADTVPRQRASKPLMDPIPTLPPVTHKVYLDVVIPDKNQYRGRIVLGLFGGSHAPKMAENFRALCACDMGRGRRTGKELCFKGSAFHRIIPNFMIQGGDFTHFDGTGGESIYGDDVPDESFAVKHNRKYLLSSAHRGRRNSNGSQFFITTVKAQWLDEQHHVVFGLVLEGEDVVNAIESEGTNGGHPKREVRIEDSGVLEVTEKDRQPIPVARPSNPSDVAEA